MEVDAADVDVRSGPDELDVRVVRVETDLDARVPLREVEAPLPRAAVDRDLLLRVVTDPEPGGAADAVLRVAAPVDVGLVLGITSYQ